MTSHRGEHPSSGEAERGFRKPPAAASGCPCGIPLLDGAGSRTPAPQTVPRDGLEAKIHQRVDVRVLELVNERTGQSLQLEGNRLQITLSKDVMLLLA